MYNTIWSGEWKSISMLTMDFLHWKFIIRAKNERDQKLSTLQLSISSKYQGWDKVRHIQLPSFYKLLCTRPLCTTFQRAALASSNVSTLCPSTNDILCTLNCIKGRMIQTAAKKFEPQILMNYQKSIYLCSLTNPDISPLAVYRYESSIIYFGLHGQQLLQGL